MRSSSSASSRASSTSLPDEMESDGEKEEDTATANLFVPISGNNGENDPTNDLLKFTEENVERL